MADTIYTDKLECDGDCGATIEVVSRIRNDRDADIAAKALGWKSCVNPPRKGKTVSRRSVEVYCPFCQEKAIKIVSLIKA